MSEESTDAILERSIMRILDDEVLTKEEMHDALCTAARLYAEAKLFDYNAERLDIRKDILEHQMERLNGENSD